VYLLEKEEGGQRVEKRAVKLKDRVTVEMKERNIGRYKLGLRLQFKHFKKIFNVQ